MMRTEIGSEFWSMPLKDTATDFFPSDTAWFLSGRSALEAIIADIKSTRNIRIARLPSWCCDSMITPFLRRGIEVSFYPVRMENGRLVQDVPEAGENEILFVMDYFGFRSNVQISRGKSIIIRDVTHSLFSAEYSDADYYFGSLRKWCGIATGGFAIGIETADRQEDVSYVFMRRAAMAEKAKYICKSSESKGFLNIFAEAEEHLDTCPVSKADEEDIMLAQRLNIDLIRAARRNNASVLLDSVGEFAMFNTLGENDCPLFVPILLPERVRNDLRSFLISKEIYTPIHWPKSPYHKLDRQTECIYNSELSLVCDQRYSENDMYRIVDTINEYLKR